jgi:hypothetical protein
LCGQTIAQDTLSDFYNNIKKYDLSTVFAPDSIMDDTKQNIKRAEPIGFIDTIYHRFYIHFTTVTKNTKNPYEYNVIGKTRVKNNICNFEGTIKIIESAIGRYDDFPKYKRGIVTCKVLLYEDKNQASSGFIKGELTTQFIIDEKGKLKYDALMLIADSYSNNDFKGTWTSYKTNKTKVCNWGDYRIPSSSNLDIGAGEFVPADKYLQNGWQTYRDAYTNNNKLALIEEKKKWWK